MFDLFDDDQPAPVIGLSGLLALIAGGGTAVWEAIMIWETFAYNAYWMLLGIFLLPFTVGLPVAGTALLCAAAMHFHQKRWAVVSCSLVAAGLVIPLVVVLIVRP